MPGRKPWQLAMLAAVLAAGVLTMSPGARTTWLNAYISGLSQKPQESAKSLMNVAFANVAMAPLRALYGDLCNGLTGIEGNYELLVVCLAAYMLARLNVLRKREGLPLIPLPPRLQQVLDVRNIVAEARTGQQVVSLLSSLSMLQLHNVFALDDPFGIQAARWYAHAAASVSSVDRPLFHAFLRTCLFVFKTRSLEVLQYIADTGLFLTPAAISSVNREIHLFSYIYIYIL